MKTKIKSKFLFVIILASGCRAYIGHRTISPPLTDPNAYSIPTTTVAKSENKVELGQAPFRVADSSVNVSPVKFTPSKKTTKKSNEMVLPIKSMILFHERESVTTKPQKYERKPATTDALWICLLLITPLQLLPLFIAIYGVPRLWRKIKSERNSDRKKVKTSTVILFTLCTGVVIVYLIFLTAFLYLLLSGEPWFG